MINFYFINSKFKSWRDCGSSVSELLLRWSVSLISLIDPVVPLFFDLVCGTIVQFLNWLISSLVHAELPVAGVVARSLRSFKIVPGRIVSVLMIFPLASWLLAIVELRSASASGKWDTSSSHATSWRSIWWSLEVASSSFLFGEVTRPVALMSFLFMSLVRVSVVFRVAIPWRRVSAILDVTGFFFVAVVFSGWASPFVPEMAVSTRVGSYSGITRIVSWTRLGWSAFLRLIPFSLWRFLSPLDDFLALLFGLGLSIITIK